jgi:F-type H+-transporting ATPase subunit a
LSVTGLYTGVLADFDPLLPIVSKPIFTFPIGRWEIAVSNHMFTVTIAMMLLLVAIPLATRSRRPVPKGLRNLVESVCVFLREQLAMPILHGRTDRYIGFVWTVFFFVLSLNLLGMIPIEQAVVLLTGKEIRLGGPATANIWVTGAMAIIAFFMTHISGIREQGLWHYIVNFTPPVPMWLKPFIYLLEIISSFVKPFTLAIRLFANMIAGHMVLAALLGLILIFKSYGVAVASVLGVVVLSFIELLIAFLQAYVFTLLSTLYIGLSTAPEH